MAGINTGSVIKGGLAAGVLINISEAILNMPVLGAQFEAFMKSLNLPPVSGVDIGYFVLMGFVQGGLIAWLYAAIRPRLGPGPKTATIAGLFVWFFASFVCVTGFAALGMFPRDLLLITLVWTLVEQILAAQVAGWIYSEA
jgi:hypothetical protein